MSATAQTIDCLAEIPALYCDAALLLFGVALALLAITTIWPNIARDRIRRTGTALKAWTDRHASLAERLNRGMWGE